MTGPTHPGCPTCTCPPRGDHVIVYPPNERIYGRCDECGQPRWDSERFPGGRGTPERRTHCGCCPEACRDHLK